MAKNRDPPSAFGNKDGNKDMLGYGPFVALGLLLIWVALLIPLARGALKAIPFGAASTFLALMIPFFWLGPEITELTILKVGRFKTNVEQATTYLGEIKNIRDKIKTEEDSISTAVISFDRDIASAREETKNVQAETKNIQYKLDIMRTLSEVYSSIIGKVTIEIHMTCCSHGLKTMAFCFVK